MPPASAKNPTYSTNDEQNAADALSTRADYTTITVTRTDTQYIYPCTTWASPPTMLNHFDWPTPRCSRKESHSRSKKHSKPSSSHTSAENKFAQDSASATIRAGASKHDGALHSLRVSSPQRHHKQALTTLSTHIHILPSNTAPSATPTTTSVSQKSTYLAPRATNHHTHNAATLRYRHPSLIGRSNMGEFDLPPMPASLQIVLYVGIALGSVWVLTVWLVNFPPHVWVEGGDANVNANAKKKEKEKAKKRKKKDRKQGKWWECTIPGLQQAARAWTREGKKPVDKPNKYVFVPSASTSLESSTNSTASASSGHSQSSSVPALVNGMATTSATPTRAGHGDEEDAGSVRKRRPTQSPGQEQGQELAELQRQPLSPSPTIPPWQRNLPQLQRHGRAVQQQPQPLPRSPHTNGTMTAPPSPGIHVTPSPEPPSPENPYLPPPSLHPRSNNEYLAAHRAFFNSKTSTPPLCSPSPSPSLSPSASLSNFSYEDIDALEAQTALPSHRRSKSEVHLTPNGYDGYAGSRTKKRWSGVNLLEAVDGAVSWSVDKMVKWTDDADDELLLPLVGSKAREAE